MKIEDIKIGVVYGTRTIIELPKKKEGSKYKTVRLQCNKCGRESDIHLNQVTQHRSLNCAICIRPKTSVRYLRKTTY